MDEARVLLALRLGGFDYGAAAGRRELTRAMKCRPQTISKADHWLHDNGIATMDFGVASDDKTKRRSTRLLAVNAALRGPFVTLSWKGIQALGWREILAALRGRAEAEIRLGNHLRVLGVLVEEDLSPSLTNDGSLGLSKNLSVVADSEVGIADTLQLAEGAIEEKEQRLVLPSGLALPLPRPTPVDNRAVMRDGDLLVAPGRLAA